MSNIKIEKRPVTQIQKFMWWKRILATIIKKVEYEKLVENEMRKNRENRQQKKL